MLRLGARSFLAPRIALTIKLGRDIEHGKLACHTCDNPACTRPDHLYEGDFVTNMRDCVSRGRHKSNKGKYRTATRAALDARVTALEERCARYEETLAKMPTEFARAFRELAFGKGVR